MRNREDIMREVSGPDVYALQMGRRFLEVMLDIREQNARIEAMLAEALQKEKE
jgi:hypothetical protein